MLRDGVQAILESESPSPRVAWRLLSLERGWSHAERGISREADDASVFKAGEGCSGADGPQSALRAGNQPEHRVQARVATQLGYGVESVRSWVRQADIDDGVTAGVTSQDSAKVKQLQQEVRELRRANEILKRAATFFGAELDRQQQK